MSFDVQISSVSPQTRSIELLETSKNLLRYESSHSISNSKYSAVTFIGIKFSAPKLVLHKIKSKKQKFNREKLSNLIHLIAPFSF